MTTGAPEEWVSTTLADAVGSSRWIIAGPFGSNLTQDDYIDEGVPVIRGTNMNGRYIGGSFAFVSEQKANELKSNLVRPGDIVVTQRGTLGQVCLIPKETKFSRFVVSQSQMAVRSNNNIDTEFLYIFLTSQIFMRYVERSTVQTGLPHINLGLLRQAPIILPPLGVQRRIAEILSKWDDALERLSRQIARKAELFASLRERLIHGAARIGQRNSEWPMVALSDVTTSLTKRNGARYSRDRVMGVTKAEGVVPMREHVVAEDISRYLVLPPKGFAYNPMRINIGSIAMSHHAGDVIVSPDYVVLACREERLRPRFLDHVRRTKAWADYMTIAGNGSVRVRIYYADLGGFEFHLPPVDEQDAIIDILSDGEREMSALQAEQTALTKQRDALATELLTGRLRVQEAEADL